MTSISTAPETRARALALSERLANPEHKAMMDLWLEHWWGEVQYDIDPVIRTLSKDVTYRSYGAATFGEVAIDGIDATRTMYQSMFDAGLMPGGPIDDERFAFGDWGMVMEGVFTAVFAGEMLSAGAPGLKPDGLYRMRWHMVVTLPMDMKAGLIKGEIMYPGPPLSIDPSDAAEVARLLGR